MKRWSQFFIPTLKESPADAEIVSHKLLVRAGLVRKLSGGLYTFMPLGLRVMQKLSGICREELERFQPAQDRAGAIELWMPHVHPVELWEQGPRWAAAREIMFRTDHAGAGKGRSKEPEFVLGPTHEEVITPLVKQEISSYRDLPKNFYQIATKFRNEIRPRYGLMRAREFVMMDAYSFDADDAGATDAGHHFVAAELAQTLRHEPRRCEDVIAEFGVLVQRLTPAGDFLLHLGGAVENGHELQLPLLFRRNGRQRRNRAANALPSSRHIG